MAFQISSKTTINQISAANTNLNGTGTIIEIFNAQGTYGGVLSTIRIQSESVVPSGAIRFFMRHLFNGTWYLLKEVAVPDVGLNEPYEGAWASTVDVNLMLENDYRIGVSTHTANTFDIHAFGYDITGFI